MNLEDFTTRIYVLNIFSRVSSQLRVYLPKYQIAAGQANYSLEALKSNFDYYEERFGIDYALPKMGS